MRSWGEWYGVIELTRRAESGGIDCRIISTGLLGGVHGKATKPAGDRESCDHGKVIATCPEMFGLAS